MQPYFFLELITPFEQAHRYLFLHKIMLRNRFFLQMDKILCDDRLDYNYLIEVNFGLSKLLSLQRYHITNILFDQNLLLVSSSSCCLYSFFAALICAPWNGVFKLSGS